MKLTHQQQQAVDYLDGHCLISAGPGSGKTRCIAAKVTNLIQKHNIRPERILALTFTNKAANEMKDRIIDYTGIPKHHFPYVRTIHSLCLEIMNTDQRYADKVICEDKSRRKLIKELLSEPPYNQITYKPRYIIKLISLAKNYSDPLTFFSEHQTPSELVNLYHEYNNKLSQLNLVDFDDLLILARDIIQDNNHICQHYKDKFDYILVDEFQDTSYVQFDLIVKLVVNGRITLVGDDYQSIYKFRGANPSTFISLTQNNNLRVFKLEENHRSTRQIVAASQALISRNNNQLPKNCYSQRDGDQVNYCAVQSEYEEAQLVTDAIVHFYNRGIHYNEIAVLFRKVKQGNLKFTNNYEQRIRAYGIPYQIIGSSSLFDDPEIKTIHAYLCSSVNIKDDLSFLQVLKTPKCGIGATKLDAIKSIKINGLNSLREKCRELILHRQSFPEIKLSNDTYNNLKAKLVFLKSIENEKPDIAIDKFMTEMKFNDYLSEKYEGEALSNINDLISELTKIAADYDTILDYINALSLDSTNTDENDRDCVTLSTIHRAKGLEFKVVIMPALEENILPDYRAVTNPGVNYEQIEEERRVAFVGMTRAIDHLVLSYSTFRNNKPTIPSRFYHESQMVFGLI